MLQPTQPPPAGVPERRGAVLRTQDDVGGHLHEELRAAARSDGLDPQREVAAVRHLAETMVRDHDDRSLTGVVAPVADVDGTVAELVARVSGFRPLQPLSTTRPSRNFVRTGLQDAPRQARTEVSASRSRLPPRLQRPTDR